MASADPTVLSNLVNPQPPAAMPTTTAIGGSAGAPTGPVNLTPAAPAAGAPPPSSAQAPGQNLVTDYDGFMHYLKSARDEIYMNAMNRRRAEEAQIAQSNPLGYQEQVRSRQFQPMLDAGETAQLQAIGHAAGLGTQYAAQGLPWEQAKQMLSTELNPVFAKANAAANALQGKKDLQTDKEREAEKLLGLKHDYTTGEIGQRASQRIGQRTQQLQLIKTTDPDGNVVQTFVPKQAGTFYAAPESATIRDRQNVAKVSVDTGNELLGMLQDPDYRSQFGAVLGKYKNLEAAAGAGDPLAMELKGELMGFSSLQLKIHGSRAYQIAQDVRNLLTIGQTPEAFEGGLKGIMKTSQRLATSTSPASGIQPPPGGGGIQPPPTGQQTAPRPQAQPTTKLPPPEGSQGMMNGQLMVYHGGRWVPAQQPQQAQAPGGTPTPPPNPTQ